MTPPEDPTSTARTRYTLLTGATGLLGRYLLRDLLRAGEPVAVLVRAAKTPAEGRIGALLDLWAENGDAGLPRPVVLTGDVSQPALGLDATSRSWLAEHASRVVHNAAVVRFHGRSRRGEPWRTNVQGTGHVLDLCREVGVDDFHYVSTAYVCGDRAGTILESDLDTDQGFRNAYEESKFEAESAVDRAGDIAHRTVYRPGVIAGDARTGYTSTYHGYFVYLHALSVLIPGLKPDADGVRRIPYHARLPLDEPRNIVPVDWVSEAIARLLAQPEARGRRYHLTPADPITPRRTIEYAARYYRAGAVEVVEPRGKLRLLRHLALALRLLRSYENYGGTEGRFDTANLTRFVPDMPCPTMDEAMVHRFLAYAESDGWGR